MEQMNTACPAADEDRKSSVLDGRRFETLVRAGWQRLLQCEREINELNVFPVPDGDTGSNMRVTIENGVRNAHSSDHIDEYTSSLSKGMLLGARGNSGVIFSQIFKGIALALKGKKVVTALELAQALKRGYEVAYSAVLYPTEGTILTVAREGIDKIIDSVDQDTSIEELFRKYLEQMRSTLNRTPEILEVLKRAEVVDSGGMGLVRFFEGVVDPRSAQELHLEGAHSLWFPGFVDVQDAYGFCTEFILNLDAPLAFDIKKLKDYLDACGHSVIALQDGSLVKVHLHTETPLAVLAYAQRMGTFVNVKIENMDAMTARGAKPEHRHQKPQRKIGYIAVAQGDGEIQALEDLGCDIVLNGGQTMNTSVEEFLGAFEQLKSEFIVVLPDNANIELAAQQARELSGREGIYVLRTHSIAEGYFAMSMAVGDSNDIDAQLSAMKQGIDGVITLRFARAMKDTDAFGLHCAKDDYIGVEGEKLLSSSPDLAGSVVCALHALPGLEERESVLLFRGQMVTEDEADDLVEQLSEEFPELEFGVIYGGQDVYDLVLGIT